MKRQEYKVLVKEWNNFLLVEEKVCLLEESLLKNNLINENFLKRLREKGIKNSIIIPLLLMKAMSLTGTAHADTPVHTYKQPVPTYQQVEARGKDEGVNVGLEDYKEACKVLTSMDGLSPDDLNDESGILNKVFGGKNEQEVNKMFLKAFEKGYNDLEDKNIVKLFPGMYTKVTAHCLGHDSSEAATEKIYNAITEINKSKSNDLKKINITSEFDLYVGKMDPQKYKEYTNQITKIFFEKNLKVTKDNKALPDLKQNILKKISNIIFKKIENKKEVGLTYPYFFFKEFFNQAIARTIKDSDLKGVSIELTEVKSGSHGGLVLLSDSATLKIIMHELGHALSMNIDDARQNSNDAYYGFVKDMNDKNQKIFSLKDVVKFLLKRTNALYDLEINNLDDLNSEGKSKMIKNASLLVNMLIGGGGISPLEDGKFKLEIESTRWDQYLHSLEERIETLHVFLESKNLEKDSAIKLFKKMKKIIKAGEVVFEGKVYDIEHYSELQHAMASKGIEIGISTEVLSFFGVANMSTKKYNKDYALGQIDNLIKLTEVN